MNESVLAWHQARLQEGKFFIQRCSACAHHVYFPRAFCPHCGGDALEWTTPAGTGTVYAATTVRRKPTEGGDLNVSLIDLDEGVRLMSRIDGIAADDVHIGLRVRAKVVDGLVLFAPADGGSA
ncbi:Zn-ribbon domain-containing OB-fold protein [Variovorax paradoxus]|uniref:Zn-ribbon domain-containing OB-fold protein n=1 Tax=Variovorax paradoxus TaxID=34073 RepID=UPI0019317B55|nr:OB-fold domain-containing protein [Variovorax paradoxus]